MINLSEEVRTEEDNTQLQPEHAVHAEHHAHIPHNRKKHEALLSELHEYITSGNFKMCLVLIAIYAVMSLVMFWYITIHLNSVVAGPGGDVYQSMWNLWWTPYAIFTLHHTSPYFTNQLFFPVGADLVTQTLFPLAGILTAPIQALGLPVAYNIVFFLGFILSGLFSFMLLRYLTKDSIASFIGSLVFAFSPMHTAQAIGHLNWASIEFVPLFLLLFILMVNERKFRYVLGSAISFLFLIFFGDPEQGIMMVAFVGVLAIFYLLLKRRTDLLNKKFAIRFGEMTAIILILGSPFLIPIIGGLLSPSTASTASQLSGTVNQMLWSDNLASYFLPSYYNGIFNGVSHSYFNSIYGLLYQNLFYTPDVTEKVSYLGYSVLFLAMVALYFDFKRHKLRNTALWTILLLIFGWLSLGPYIQIMGTVTGIPAIYAVYSHIPIFNLIREPGRFDMMVTLCLAILAAIGFAYLTEGKSSNQKLLYAAVFFAFIMIEYNAMPLSQSFASSLSASATIPAAYGQIGALQGNFTVLPLPIVPDTNSSAPELYPALAMYYSTAMGGKSIIGGYTSRENQSQLASADEIPLASAAAYLQQGYGLIYPSPVAGNFTNETLLWLENYNTQFITVTRSAYNISEQSVLYNYLYGVFGQPLYTSNTTFVFGTKNAVLSHANKALTAYSIGTWIPGYNFCGSQGCNASFGTLWWGTNARGVDLFSPNKTKVIMNFTAAAAINGTQLYLYLDNAQLGSVKLSGTPRAYSLGFNASAGYNQVVFYAQNDTALPSPYIVYGIKNITFARST